VTTVPGDRKIFMSLPTLEPRPPAPGGDASASPALEALGVCRRYGRRWALVDVSFTVAAGTALMVAGRNGSGKSTLLRVLATAIRPDRGAARILGHDIRTSPDAVRRHLALLGHASNLYEALTPLDNLGVAARFLGRDASRAGLLSVLDEVGLADRADDPVVTFSAGMRKRLAIARVLLQEASVVLLDEPYGQLDPPGFRLIDRLFARLRARGATVLVATHMLERAGASCDDGIVLDRGRLAWAGRAAELPARGGLDQDGLPEGGP
jgi:heme exporter protein A